MGELKLAITEKTKAELEARGIKVDPNVRVVDSADPGIEIVVCMPYRGPLGAPMTLPDNVIGDCSWHCGRKIEHRPDLPAAAKKICVPCYNSMMAPSAKH